MANVHKKNSIQDLLELDHGISAMIQVFTANNNFDPSCFGKKAWQGIYRVLEFQQDVQIELRERLLKYIPEHKLDSNMETE